MTESDEEGKVIRKKMERMTQETESGKVTENGEEKEENCYLKVIRKRT